MAMRRGISHEEYLRTTSARENQEYRALELISPSLEDRIDAGFAKLAWIIHSMMRSSESESTTIQDWTPDYASWLRDDPTEADRLSDEYDKWYETIGKRMMEQGEA